MANPAQLGSGFVLKVAPTFLKYVVVDNTWKEKDNLQLEQSRGGDSNMVNITGWSPGTDCSCEWWVKEAQTPAAKLDIVQEQHLVANVDDGTGRKFVVLDVETNSYGGRKLKQTITLGYFNDGFNTAVAA